MATKSQPKSAEQADATPQTDEAKYTRAELIAGAAAFGTHSHVVAGAIHGIDKDELTRAEAEQAIQDFLKKEV